MASSNKEMQLRKTCQLYAYVLSSLGREVPEAIQDCMEDDDYLVDCVDQLASTLEGLDPASFEMIVNSDPSSQARDLAKWWKMRQEADKLHSTLASLMK